MNILIDIGHPGQVHYFKHAIKILRSKGHKIVITARNKGIIFELLRKHNLEFIDRGKGSNSLIGKLFYMVIADIRLIKVALKFKPDLYISFSSPYAAQVSYLFRKPHIALTDTEHEDSVLSKITYPFSSTILTPRSYLNDLGKKHIRFNSVVEGLYLHKNFFTPKPIKKELGIEENDDYVIIRFVAWDAHHDFRNSGLDMKTKRELINILEEKYKVFISSESVLPEEFEKYKIKIPSERMHDVLASAHLFIGESATMSSESALLGTYAVYINSLPLMGYLKMEQDQNLLKHFDSSHGVIDYVNKLISDPDLKNLSVENAEKMNREFINATEFLVWFIENYPESHRRSIEETEYQKRFK